MLQQIMKVAFLNMTKGKSFEEKEIIFLVPVALFMKRLSCGHTNKTFLTTFLILKHNSARALNADRFHWYSYT